MPGLVNQVLDSLAVDPTLIVGAPKGQVQQQLDQVDHVPAGKVKTSFAGNESDASDKGKAVSKKSGADKTADKNADKTEKSKSDGETEESVTSNATP